MHKDPKGIASRFCGAINQFPVITYFTVIATLTAFFNLNMYQMYHEMLSKDSCGLSILLGILQSESILHLVQQAESRDLSGSGKGKKKWESKGEGRRMTL